MSTKSQDHFCKIFAVLFIFAKPKHSGFVNLKLNRIGTERGPPAYYCNLRKQNNSSLTEKCNRQALSK